MLRKIVYFTLHQPLFLFWGAVLRGDPSGHAYRWTTTALVSASVFGIGYVTENQRHRLKLWIERRLLRLKAVVHQRYAA